ncbi:MAG TPA: hypothetical protein VG899_12425 [Mycobacteriales bacterium]|nr:hypothetical protein [Mycobacteriales bacterium]
MGAFVCLDFTVTVGDVDLSDHISKVTIAATVDEVDSTAFTEDWHSRLGGLKDWSVQIDFNQDFSADEVDATLWPLFGTLAAITAKPFAGSVSATNPQYSGNALISQHNPLDGQVGDLAKNSVTWPGSGALARATA